MTASVCQPPGGRASVRRIAKTASVWQSTAVTGGRASARGYDHTLPRPPWSGSPRRTRLSAPLCRTAWPGAAHSTGGRASARGSAETALLTVRRASARHSDETALDRLAAPWQRASARRSSETALVRQPTVRCALRAALPRPPRSGNTPSLHGILPGLWAAASQLRDKSRGREQRLSSDTTTYPAVFSVWVAVGRPTSDPRAPRHCLLVWARALAANSCRMRRCLVRCRRVLCAAVSARCLCPVSLSVLPCRSLWAAVAGCEPLRAAGTDTACCAPLCGLRSGVRAAARERRHCPLVCGPGSLAANSRRMRRCRVRCRRVLCRRLCQSCRFPRPAASRERRTAGGVGGISAARDREPAAVAAGGSLADAGRAPQCAPLCALPRPPLGLV